MLSRFFIDRPILAWVIAITTMLVGALAISNLPIEQYPDVAPPQVSVRASYPGASALTIENSVTQIIEQQLTGIDGLLYFTATSSARGQANISATFKKGTDPDIAQVQVQNRVQQAISRLPQLVQQQGVSVTKSNPDFLLVCGVYDGSGKMGAGDISDYLIANVQDRLARLPGVGSANVFGSQYAMRIWLDPKRLAGVSLMPGDVAAAIQAQNTELAAGELGAPPVPRAQMLTATVNARSRLSTPGQFAQIILKTNPDGSKVRLSDVARVELGNESYSSRSLVNGYPGAGISVSLSPGADALATADIVKAEMTRISAGFPAGMNYLYPSDNTDFIRLSVREVVKTLIEAIFLVVVVMFVFLKSWRVTLIPAIAVPVVLLGTFAVLWVAGFTINTLTLFGLVLAIGLLVDDAIVVVENVERVLRENPGMSPREATIRSMGEIQTALVAIAMVLSAVFVPMAFFSGSTGVIYRQFSITIVTAMVLSVAVALILSPALTTSFLKAHHGVQGPIEGHAPTAARWADSLHERVDRWYAWLTRLHQQAVQYTLARKGMFFAAFGACAVLLLLLLLRLPTGFLPTEDQGGVIVQFQLPAGAVRSRTEDVQDQLSRYMRDHEAANLKGDLTISGGEGPGSGGQNSGNGFIALKDWSERPGARNTSQAVARRIMMNFGTLRDANLFALVPGPIMGMGISGGFTMQLQNTGGLTREQFVAAREQLVAAARQDPALSQVRASETPDAPSLRVDFDPDRIAAMGLRESDVNDTLAIAWGGRYVNDFLNGGRVKRVFLQGDAPFRREPEDLAQWYVRSGDGQMAPYSSFARTNWSLSPSSLTRFMGVPSFEIQGQAGSGVSSGQAMERMAQLAGQIPGVTPNWSGLSYQERLASKQGPILYGMSLLVVFLCLAALYESWSVPVAVLLVVPLGLVGAVFAVTLRGLENDVYLQIGLVTTMGLAAKNAILMIEFAAQAEKQGRGIVESAIEAARIRLRPILMTSLAFMFGVLPLALSTGAGANSRIAIGTSVVGGVLTATVLAVVYIPLFFVAVRMGTRNIADRWHHRMGSHPSAPAPAEAR
jgi:multidrug efflux pump